MNNTDSQGKYLVKGVLRILAVAAIFLAFNVLGYVLYAYDIGVTVFHDRAYPIKWVRIVMLAFDGVANVFVVLAALVTAVVVPIIVYQCLLTIGGYYDRRKGK
ncbi:hypothetical protein [Pseudomonas yamanorum]|jgi:hypothetical protein|uniref:hypothetical protein n=1 Tax=Pseudomonas yamanorum TaxID=515393 RepID=UPI003B9FA70D|nr:hypothetical protein [Escherichia coli]